MIDLDQALDAFMRVFPDKDEDVAREFLTDMVKEVREADVEPGDFLYHATYGLHVQKVHYVNDGVDAVRVFVEVASDYDHGELI